MLLLVDDNARFNDSFQSFDMRLGRTFKFGDRLQLQAMGEVFNLFNKANILGRSNINYAGFENALAPDHNDPMHSSSFGKPSVRREKFSDRVLHERSNLGCG